MEVRSAFLQSQGIVHQLQCNSAALKLSNFGEHSSQKKKSLTLLWKKVEMFMFCPRSHKETRA